MEEGRGERECNGWSRNPYRKRRRSGPEGERVGEEHWCLEEGRGERERERENARRGGGRMGRPVQWWCASLVVSMVKHAGCTIPIPCPGDKSLAFVKTTRNVSRRNPPAIDGPGW